MPRIRKLSASAFDSPPARKERELTPAQKARLARENEFRKVIEALKGPEDVFGIFPADGEKPATLRLAFTKLAKQRGKNVVLRSYENGFAVALATPERERSRRGRKPKAQA